MACMTAPWDAPTGIENFVGRTNPDAFDLGDGQGSDSFVP